MVAELNVRINSAKEYNIDAEGKDTVTLNLSEGDVQHQEVIDGKLVLSLTGDKKVYLSHFNKLTQIKTSLDDVTSPISLDGGAKNSVTNPISENNYVGTAINDDINALSAPEQTAIAYRKVKKKWVPYEYGTGVGVNIDAGAGNDIIKGSDHDDIINAGDGNDTIYIGKGNDTITGGAGTNTYIIDTQTEFGTTTINLTQNEKLHFVLKGVPNTDHWDYLNYEQSGDDMLIKVYKRYPVSVDDNPELTGTIILKDFAKEEKVSEFKVFIDEEKTQEFSNGWAETYKDLIDSGMTYMQAYQINIAPDQKTFLGTRWADTIDASGVSDLETYSYKYKKKWRTGTRHSGIGITIDSGAGTDTITGSDFNDTIYAGDGGDTITGGKGDDYIKGGLGTNILKFSNDFGDDTVELTDNEDLILDLSAYGTTAQLASKVTKATVGNDLKITVKDGDEIKGTITLLDYAKTNVVGDGSVSIKGSDTTNALDISSVASANYSTVGSRFVENIINAEDGGHDAGVNWVKVKKKWRAVPYDAEGVTITGGDNKDIITGSKYSDHITGGDGENIINIKTSENFGDDVYHLTTGETLKLKLDGDATVNKEFIGTDLKLTVISGGNTRGTITLKDFGTMGDTLTAADILNSDDSPNFNLKTGLSAVIDNNIELGANDHLYVGNFMSENIDASAVQEYKWYETVGKGKKRRTIEHATGEGATIYAGKGSNLITGSKFNDTIYGAESNSNDLMVTTKEKFGNDTYVLSKDEIVKIWLSDVDYVDDATTKAYTSYEFDGSDIVLSVYNSTTLHDDEHLMGTVTIKDFGKDEMGTAKVRLCRETGATVETISDSIATTLQEKTYTAGEMTAYNGTRFDDVVDASQGGHGEGINYVKVKKKWRAVPYGAEGVTINTGLGDDEITGSAYNDTITGGAGENVVYLSTDNTFGEDSYYLSEDETTLKLKLNGENAGDYDTKVIGNDLVVTVYNKDKNAEDTLVMGKLKIMNYGVEAPAATIRIYGTGDNIAGSGVVLSPSATEAVDIDGGSYTGTRLNDTIDASNASQVMGARSVKVKKKWKTYWDVPTGEGVDIDGGAGDDTITGSNYNDILKGGEGRDTIVGGLGDDTIYGGASDDVITGGLGDDKIYGGAGSNTIYFNKGDGHDIVYSDGGTDYLHFNGVSRDELTFASNGKDLIIRYSDNGTVTLDSYFTEGSSVKWLWTTTYGNQTIESFIDNFNLTYEFAQIGNVEGTENADAVIGTSGNDIIDALAGNDRIYGEAGDDTIDGGEGNDYIYGGAGNDTIHAGDGTDRVYGEDGNDIIYGDSGDKNYLYGGAGNDEFHSGTGVDEIHTGSGENTVYITDGTRAEVYLEGEKNTVYIGERASNGSDIYLGSGNDIIYMSEESSNGSNGGDFIINSNTMKNGGHDTFYWRATEQNNQGDMMKFNGSTYDDLIFTRNAGSDDLIVRYGDDNTVTYKDYFKEGNEEIIGNSLSLYVPERAYPWMDFSEVIEDKGGVKTLINGVTGTDDCNDYIVGTDNSETINGKAGNDVIKPNGGDDIIILGTGNDVLFAGDGDKQISANEGNNIIYLGSGNNTVNLGFDSDTVHTGSGSNLFTFPVDYMYADADEGDDTYYFSAKEGENKDTFRFQENLSTVSLDARDSENLVLTRNSGRTVTIKNYTDTDRTSGITIESVSGGTSSNLFNLNTKIGSATSTSNQTLATGTGNDTIYAGKGSDTITTGTGTNIINLSALADAGNNDTFTYTAGAYDTIVLPESITNFDDLSIYKSGRDLKIAYANDSANNTVTVKNYYNALDEVENPDGMTSYITFKAGINTQTLTALIATKGIIAPEVGTAGDDVLGDSEKSIPQTVSGLAGNDTITTGSGNDVINGGSGSDSMNGGSGNDTYIIDAADWGADKGHNTITDTSGTDTLRIDTDIAGINLYFDVTQTGLVDGKVAYTTGTDLFINADSDYTLANAKTYGGVQIVNYFTENGKIENVKFADGVTDAIYPNLIDATGQAVANWLYAHDKASVTVALAECTDEEKAELLHIYKPIITDSYVNNETGATNGPDIVIGIKTNDGNAQTIYTYGGDDVIFASDKGATSWIYAGDGNDTIYTSATNNTDRYYAGNGDDIVYVRGEATHIEMGSGNDTAYVSDGARVNIDFSGGGNNTLYLGDRQNNDFSSYVYLGSGNDTVYMNTGVLGQNSKTNGALYYFTTSYSTPEGGHDTMHWRGTYSGVGQPDMMLFAQDYEDLYFTRADGSDDLVIRYGGNNDVTYVDYFADTDINADERNAFVLDAVNAPQDWMRYSDVIEDKGLKNYISGSGGTINGTGPYHVDDYIVGSDANETIRPLGGNDYIDAKGGDDTIYITSWGNQIINCGQGSDTLYLGAVNEAETILTVYTNSKYGGKDTSLGTSDNISFGKLTSNGNTVYAQSTINLITGGQGNDNYFAYVDQKTSITDASGSDKLTLTNTDETTDGARANLHVLFNVTSDYDYDSENPETLFNGDVLVTASATKANYDFWTSSGAYQGISIVGNAVEEIKSSDETAYTLTNEDISVLAENVAGWLSTNGYDNVAGVFSNALGKADDNATDIATLIAQFDNANWHQQIA